MSKSPFTERQILAIFVEGEAGLIVAQVAHKHGISAATYYQGVRRHLGQRAQGVLGAVSRDLQAQEYVCRGGF